MKRIAIAAGVVVLGTGAAFADCGAFTETGNAASYLELDTIMSLAGSGSETCSVVDLMPRGADGRFVVYRIDARGGATLDSGAEATFSVTPDGESASTVVLEGEEDGSAEDQDVFLKRYVALGENPTGGLNADLDLALDGDYDAYFQSLDIVVAYTTLEDQEDSLDLVGLQQLALITHLDGNSTLLRGGDQPLEGENEVGLLGSYGSYNFGATARYNLAEGFSLLGGVSLFGLGAEGANASGVIATGAIRYVDPTGATVRFFGEGGFEAAGMGLSLSRDYFDGSGETEVVGSGTGLLGAAYIRGGALWEPDSNNQVVLSASVKQSVLGLFSFVEEDTDANANLFAADYSGLVTTVTTIKTGVDWTTQISHDVDLTASGAVGAAFGSGASANIFGVSEYTGEAVTGAAQSVVFAQYGLRLGWTPTADTRVEGFVQGTTGTGIGTHAQIGAAYKLQF